MSELNDLPPEILANVFGYLDVVNLKNATLTCQLWKNLIESICRWPLKLSYDEHGKLWSEYPNSAEQKMNFILTTNRKFGKIGVNIGSCLSGEANQLYQIFKRHGFNVVELTIRNCRFNSLVSIAELLNLTPNLTYANMYEVYSQNANDMPSGQVLPNLKKFKTLKITGDGQIVKCFRKAKLTTMEIGLSLGGGSKGHFVDLLVDFLLCQDTLTSLSVDSELSSILVEMGKRKDLITFRLAQLKSGIAHVTASGDHDNLLRFIKTQAESLTELTLGFNVSSAVYKCVFTSMTKLDTLVVSIYGIPQHNDFYDHLKENRSIRTIRLLNLDYGFNARFVADFFKKLPNIRHLILPFFKKRNVVAPAAQNLKQLESLSIGYFEEHSFKNATFPNLTALHIEDLDGKIDWNEFTKTHSRLAKLTIESMSNQSYLTSNDIDQISNNADLQHIRLGVGFVVDDRFFEMVRLKCTNLKTLDLDKSCIPHGLNCNVGINVLRLYDFKSFNPFRTVSSE